ncbi:potassium/proton antiporter [soil metagenome]
MFLIDNMILLTSILLLLGIASSKFSARFGVPVLVLFLGLGMLAGTDGIGGIEFNDFEQAHAIGTLALGVILFDGGLSTQLSSIRRAWVPAAILATVGVLITAILTGVAASWVLNIPWMWGVLLGSIVGSTDAAAVFSVLRSGGMRLPDRLSATLEVESGSNDPMAIFLTVGMIELLTARMDFGWELFGFFALQMCVGAAIGIGMGFAGVWLVNRINLEAAGLYPVLATAVGMLSYGLAASLQGSGFLAIYLAGIILGSRRIVFQRGIFAFHDAAAWFAQILMFAVLGLLSTPSRLLGIAGPALLIAVILVFVARPIAVFLTMLPFRFGWRELTFLSWGGLKGAVPITLATFPFLLGLGQQPHVRLLFDVIFFVVLVSVIVQGWTLPLMARKLGLQRPREPDPPVTLELSSLRHVEGDIVDFTIDPDSRAAGRLVRDLALPDGAVIAIIAREDQIIPPQGGTRVQPGDHVVLVLRPGTRPLVNKIFGKRGSEEEELPPRIEFPLRATTRVGQLEAFYGLLLDAPPDRTLAEAIVDRLGPDRIETGRLATFGSFGFYIREIDDNGKIEQVGMVILAPEVPEGS